MLGEFELADKDLHFCHVSTIVCLINNEAQKKNMASHDKSDIVDILNKGDGYLYVKDGVLGGFVCLDHWTDYIEISALLVAERFRNKKLGSRLFELARNLAFEKYPEKQILVMGNNISSKIARRHGFVNANKKELGSEILTLCVKNCLEYDNFPNCHCQALLFKE